MIEAFAEAGQPLFVAFYRRRLPRFLKAKELIDSGRLGEVTMLTYRYAKHGRQGLDPERLPWRLVAEHAGGGLLLTWAPTPWTSSTSSSGRSRRFKATAANLASPCDMEDTVAMHCRFACGGMGVCSWNFAAAADEDMIEISGTEGKITLSVFGNEPVRLETAAGVEQFDLPNPPHIQQPLIQSIVDQLHGQGECPSTGVTAARTSRVMDEVLAGYYGGREDAFWARPDGDYMIVPRSGQVFISKAADGILGPYRSMGPSVFPKGIPNLEDPVVFYSGGFYQIVVNSWSTRKAYHLVSQDGKSNWVNRGLAYDPTKDFCRYTDGTVNHWHKMERPGVLLENGHVTAMTFAVLDTPKEKQLGNDGHGSKIIVVPFDGAAWIEISRGLPAHPRSPRRNEQDDEESHAAASCHRTAEAAGRERGESLRARVSRQSDRFSNSSVFSIFPRNRPIVGTEFLAASGGGLVTGILTAAVLHRGFGTPS